MIAHDDKVFTALQLSPEVKRPPRRSFFLSADKLHEGIFQLQTTALRGLSKQLPDEVQPMGESGIRPQLP